MIIFGSHCLSSVSIPDIEY